MKRNQDINMYATELTGGNPLAFPLAKGRQCYLVQVEGSSRINGILLNERDAMEAVEEDLHIEAVDTSHLLFIEMRVP